MKLKMRYNKGSWVTTLISFLILSWEIHCVSAWELSGLIVMRLRYRNSLWLKIPINIGLCYRAASCAIFGWICQF